MKGSMELKNELFKIDGKGYKAYKVLEGKYDFKKYLSPLSAKMMQDYSWPGNIRELRNIIERAVIISNEDEIGPDALHLFTVEDRPGNKVQSPRPCKGLKNRYGRAGTGIYQSRLRKIRKRP